MAGQTPAKANPPAGERSEEEGADADAKDIGMQRAQTPEEEAAYMAEMAKHRQADVEQAMAKKRGMRAIYSGEAK